MSKYENTESEEDDSENEIEILESRRMTIDKVCGLTCKGSHSEEWDAQPQRISKKENECRTGLRCRKAEDNPNAGRRRTASNRRQIQTKEKGGGVSI